MKNINEEINQFILSSRYSLKRKELFRRRLNDFCKYLAFLMNTPIEEINLKKIYEYTDKDGNFLFFKSMDAKIIEQYFLSQLHHSYSWLVDSRESLSSFFRYLNRKYDFPKLTEEMGFSIEKYKEKPEPKGGFVPTRHNILKFIQSLIKYSSNLERDIVFFVLLITTGSRVSEILNIKVNEIDNATETIYRKKTKNGSSKFIVLRDGIGESLQRYIKKNNLKDDDYLFKNGKDTMKRSEAQELFNFYLDKSTLPRTTLHKLRHSFATMLAESGMTMLVLQQLLGHKKINSTMTYVESNYIRNIGMEISENKEVYKYIRKVSLEASNSTNSKP
jgi:integrase